MLRLRTDSTALGVEGMFGVDEASAGPIARYRTHQNAGHSEGRTPPFGDPCAGANLPAGYGARLRAKRPIRGSPGGAGASSPRLNPRLDHVTIGAGTRYEPNTKIVRMGWCT